MYVVPRLTDGLGNRLFQYAVALGLAKKWGRVVAFSRDFLLPTNHGDSEDFFKLFPDVPFINGPTAPKILGVSINLIFSFVDFEDAPPTDVVIVGHIQSPQYFEGVHIRPAWPLVPREVTGAWMIHFRRGDYDILTQYSVDLTRYYRRCLLAVPEGSKLRVFSDEPERCKDLLESVVDGRRFDISWSAETVDYKALYEMSLCTGGAITANSTFSWWGAYFAKANAETKANTNAQDGYRAYYPSSWGSFPDPSGIVPAWGEVVETK
jgi:hypothetical protein